VPTYIHYRAISLNHLQGLSRLQHIHCVVARKLKSRFSNTNVGLYISLASASEVLWH